jgi:iron complex outermembrane receptor protein
VNGHLHLCVASSDVGGLAHFPSNLIALAVSLCSVAAIVPVATHAQRVDENAVQQAEDAFGITVGDEEIGLYSAEDARGFSPRDAGNLVIEGLYYDQQTYPPTSRIVEGSVLHVGLSAQSYPLAAPTGVVDYQLRLPGQTQVTSISVGAGPYDVGFVEVDAQFPVAKSLSVGVGASIDFNPDFNFARHSRAPSLGAVLRWQPTPAVEVVPFFGWVSYDDAEVLSLVFLGASALPPEFEQRKLPAQSWTDWSDDEFNFGVLGQVDLRRGWTLRAGVFESRTVQQPANYESLYDAQADGTAQYYIAAVPEQEFESNSGELRASKVMIEGARRHTLQLIARARDSKRRYGGDDDRFIATTMIGQVPAIETPAFVTGPRDRTDTSQQNMGVVYALLWKSVGELSVGVQRASVQRDALDGSTRETVSSDDTTTLYNATAAVSLGSRWTAFSSYSRGLEEAGIAPENAVNRREAAPLILSKQIDAGLRYVIKEGFTAVLGVFEIEKPYFGLSTDDVFQELATVTHRGVEFSVAGEVISGLDVVAGYVYLDPELSGAAVDDGSIGPVPVGPIPRAATLNVSYGPAKWKGFALEGAARYNSSYVASQDNMLEVPSATEVDLGFRYRFSLGKAPVSVRFRAMNVNDDRTWLVEPSGQAKLTEGRRYSLTVTTDL